MDQYACDHNMGAKMGRSKLFFFALNILINMKVNIYIFKDRRGKPTLNTDWQRSRQELVVGPQAS